MRWRRVRAAQMRTHEQREVDAYFAGWDDAVKILGLAVDGSGDPPQTTTAHEGEGPSMAPRQQVTSK